MSNLEEAGNMATQSDPVPYVPALKWKAGEQDAVAWLTNTQKGGVYPIAEVPDRPFNWGENKYSKSWDKHIDDIAGKTAKKWGTNHEIAVDQPIELHDKLAAGSWTPWEYLFSQLWSAKVKAVPVLSTRASGAEQAALISVSKAHKKTRWLLRFRSETHGEVPNASQVTTWFANSVAALSAQFDQCDAVLDLGHISADIKPSIVANVEHVLKAVAALGAWRSLSLSSGAFPENLTGQSRGVNQIPRRDWELYKRVSARPGLAQLRFGDYAITHVDAFDEDPRMLKMTANIRYAHWQVWHVIKGKSVRDFGFDQYKDLCAILVNLPIFLQATFSPADANYEKVANTPSVGPGNATQWRRDATNHHIHVVLHQLASLPEF
jgi:hypothetical protein